jgi:hypothetical protein
MSGLRNRITIIFVVLIFVASAIVWAYFALTPKRLALTSNYPYGIAFIVACMVILVVLVIVSRERNSWLLAAEVLGLLILIAGMFSVLYWTYAAPTDSYGVSTSTNFNIPLSRLDAVYFTMGTLSTAGTGNIVATSEAARNIQTIQMVIDFALVLIVVGIFVARLSSSNSTSAPSDP